MQEEMNTDEIAMLVVCACAIDLCIFCGYLYHVLCGVKCTAVIQTISVRLLYFCIFLWLEHEFKED